MFKIYSQLFKMAFLFFMIIAANIAHANFRCEQIFVPETGLVKAKYLEKGDIIVWKGDLLVVTSTHKDSRSNPLTAFFGFARPIGFNVFNINKSKSIFIPISDLQNGNLGPRIGKVPELVISEAEIKENSKAKIQKLYDDFQYQGLN